MINVSSWSIRNPIPAILLFLLLTLAGLMSFRAMKIQNMPDIDLPMVIVTASLPGASPAQLETEVARKIENSVATLQGVKHIYTKVQDGTVTLMIEFVLEKGTQEATEEVRDAVANVRADLPGEMRDPIVSKSNLAGTPVLTYTIASSRMDDVALSWFVDNGVSKAMLSVKGVGAVSRVGGVDRQVRVEIDPDRAPLIRWAFETYAWGETSVTGLLRELTARGLTTVPFPGSSQIAVDCWAAFDRRLTRAGISVKAGVEEGALGLAG